MLNRKVKIGEVLKNSSGHRVLITRYYKDRDDGVVCYQNLETGEENMFIAWFADGTFNTNMSHCEDELANPLAGMKSGLGMRGGKLSFKL